MAPATLFGLVVIAAGILLFTISQALTARAAKIRVNWFQPDLDRQAFQRRNVRGLRLMAGSWVVIGVGFVLFGLITGR